MVTIIDFVDHVSNESAEENLCCCFEVHTSVYESLRIRQVNFMIDCYFVSSKQWVKFSTPAHETLVAVTEKIAGWIESENCLAVCILNMSYMSKTTLSAFTFTLTITFNFSKKQADCWSCCVESTSFKRTCLFSFKKSLSSEVQHPSTSPVIKDELDWQLSTTLEEDWDSDTHHLLLTRSSSLQQSEHQKKSSHKQKW